MKNNSKETDDRKQDEQDEPAMIYILKDYGQFGKIELINLAGLSHEVDYLVYAQWK